jgi:arsenite methyltransferase
LKNGIKLKIMLKWGDNMNDVKKTVRSGYAKVAKRQSSCCGPQSSCCDKSNEISEKIGYTKDDIASVPDGADLGLGCGNPIALASLKEGEIVLDLGSGAGFDCFLAANKVGKNGKVIGIDMTPEMLEKARENATKGGYSNVEFRLGEIEYLPVADNSVDVIISNCVINLVPEKEKVFAEAFRVLKPGGRLMVSDIVLLKELPEIIMSSVAAYVGCISGAIMRDDYIEGIKKAGFQDVSIVGENSFSIDCMLNDPTANAVLENIKIPIEKIKEISESIVSIRVSGVKK